MDVAYDHIQERTFRNDEDGEKPGEKADGGSDLNTEFQEAYNAVANSPWGARLGGLWGTVKKQGEHYYEEAQKINTAASSQASKGITTLINRTRSISLSLADEVTPSTSDQKTPTAKTIPEESSAKSNDASTKEGVDEDITPHPDRPESLPADIVKEAESMLSRFRSEAAKRFKDIELAEDAADEALLNLGNNIKSFLRDAVSIAPPTEVFSETDPDRVLFESKDGDGKRVIHTTRLDAQLHVIHCSLDSFMKDPAGPEYEAWTSEFDIDKRTGDITADLDKFAELRRAMEKLVPEKVEYALFWRRYYFLRRVAELEEQRRKELLKGATSNAEQEEVGWDEDSEEEDSNTPNATGSTTTLTKGKETGTSSHKPDTLKPTSEHRYSHDQRSQPDSDASYDLVSGATSRAPSTPKEIKKEESDDEDWE